MSGKILMLIGLAYILSVELPSQIIWPEAPEKWSTPVKIRELSVGEHSFASEPTLTADGLTMYYYYYSDGKPYRISKSVRRDSIWSSPEPLNININTNLAAGPSVSADGKRLYFRMYGRSDGYGGWDLYFSDWDSLSQDWGPVKNLGSNINSWDIDEWTCMTPDNRTLYWIRYPSLPRISKWVDSTQSWGPSEWVDLYRFLSAYGRVSVVANQRKIYYDPFVESSNPHDIYVHYYDSVSRQWSNPMVLNINRMMDTLVSSSFQRIQQHPWISPDGKLLYFASTHDSAWSIWMCKLMIDERGNPVSVESPQHEILPGQIRLWQNFPNPFNSTTSIEYEIPTAGQVKISIFDLLGRDVVTLVNEQKGPGRHVAMFDANGLQSGVYFYRLITAGYTETEKMILLK